MERARRGGIPGRAPRRALRPALTDAGLAALEAQYGASGFAVTARRLALDEVRALPTTWANRLAFSGRDRAVVELRGRATPAAG